MDEPNLVLKITSKIARRSHFVINPLRKYYRRYQRILNQRAYHAWAVQNEENCYVSSPLADSPVISIVVPAYNTPQTHLLSLIYSITNQHYQNWQLILVNGSTDDERRAAID